MTPFFTCVVCGKRHVAPRLVPNPRPLNERQKLREEMVKAIELWDQNPGVESYERKVIRTEMAYYSSLGGPDGWGFPELMTTSKKGNSGWVAHCLSCEP